MGLEELTFEVEGVKVMLKPELHIYYYSADDAPVFGLVPVKVHYSPKKRDRDDNTGAVYTGIREEKGNLRYDTGKRIFITALSDFVPTDPEDIDLFEKYSQGISEIARVYSLLRTAIDHKTMEPVVKKRNFYRNSQGEWKDIGGYWLGVESHEELLKMADAVK